MVIGRQGQSKQTDSNCPEMYFIAVGGGGHQTLLYTKGHFPQVKLFGRLSATKRLTFAPFSQLGLIVGFDPPNLQVQFWYINYSVFSSTINRKFYFDILVIV